mgnify:CR=1 FL=1
MNPGSDPKRFLPQRRKLLENENEMEKSELHFRQFFRPETLELTRAMARLSREGRTLPEDSADTPLQQFGVLAASVRIRAGLSVAALAQRSGVSTEDIYAIELGAADLKQVSAAVAGLEAGLNEPRLSHWLAGLVFGED